MAGSGRGFNDSIVVTCMEKLGCGMLIKNTFLELNDASSVSHVRRWSSDPRSDGRHSPHSPSTGCGYDSEMECMSSVASTCLDSLSDVAWLPTPETSPRNPCTPAASPFNVVSVEAPRCCFASDESQRFTLWSVPSITPLHRALAPSVASYTFSVKLRRVGARQFGISIELDTCTNMPVVASLMAHSVVDSYNQIVRDTPKASTAILPRDIIVSINGETTVSKMQSELFARMLVCIELRRMLHVAI